MATKLDQQCEEFIYRHFPGQVGTGIAKLPEELVEFTEDPGINEAADVFLCVLIEMVERGFTLSQLLFAAEEKMQLNLRREWVRREDGTIHHI